MYIGIDPGVAGAITVLDSDGSYVETIAMPMEVLSGSTAYKQWYDVSAIVSVFERYRNATVALEYQRPIVNRYGQKASAGGQGAVAIFRTGRGFGLLEGLVRVYFDKYYIVDPNRWQNFLASKYLTREERVALKSKTPNYEYLIECIDHGEYRKWYAKHVGKKSLTKAKKKTAYIFYKVFKSMNYDVSINWKNNNYVDSFLIAKYLFDQRV